MSQPVCLTVDVEDFYEGIAVLGQPVPRPPSPRSGLAGLRDLLTARPKDRVTLFVVGRYAPDVAASLAELAQDGHEIASHGPDHGRLPRDARQLEAWLRRGRESLEDLIQHPVRGFRSPRFETGEQLGLARFREVIARAGFTYVSDRHCLGPTSPVSELPVLVWRGVPVGGGSYQRMAPRRLLEYTIGRAAEKGERPMVLYYHSYDFGATLPRLAEHPSVTLARQVLGRRRIQPRFVNLLQTYGSNCCGNVLTRI
jgi:peptidoglycan/xylan/chitin deacetylase (PgdA/CDA1 family)